MEKPKKALDLEQATAAMCEQFRQAVRGYPNNMNIHREHFLFHPLLHSLILFDITWKDEVGYDLALEQLKNEVLHFDVDWKAQLDQSGKPERDYSPQVNAWRVKILESLKTMEEQHTVSRVVSGHLKWMGNTAELCSLLKLLVEKGWIEVPRSWSKLAEQVHAIFQGTTGEPMDAETLKQYLKPSEVPQLRPGVSFSVSKCPKKK